MLSNPERRQLYDRFGHAGLRSRGFEPGGFDFGNLSDLFSAFFGDDLFAGATRQQRRGRGAERGVAEVAIDLVDADAGSRCPLPFEIAVTCARCHGNGAEPGATITGAAT